ncbi:hypothetical protein P9112_013000 [Eukaryota sp. TZLM1-RC]
MTLLLGTVFAVPSGDTVVLMGKPPKPNSPPVFKTLTLNYISAPRYSFRGNSEVYGFTSREFLRTLLIGCPVQFSIESSSPTGRDFGDLVTKSIPSISVHVIKNGWAKVKDFQGEPSTKQQQLLDAQAHAAEHHLGIWQDPSESKKHIVEEEEEIQVDPTPTTALTNQITSSVQNCIIDHVITGSFIRVIIIDRHPMLSISVSLAGISCPSFRRDESGCVEADPFAEEAKFFNEVRLLHRTIPIEIHSFDERRNQWIGSLRASQGDFQHLLLSSGLAKLQEWQLTYTPQTAPSLREAERVAKISKKKIWEDFVPPQNLVRKERKYGGLVVEVSSGDCISIKIDGEIKRIYLASTRAPRMGTRERRPDPLGFESREFLRRKLIGQNVEVEPCYVVDDRQYADVLYDSACISLLLVNEGLAHVIKGGKQQDQPKSRFIDALIAAEIKAKASKKGVFLPSDQQPRFLYQDLTLAAPGKAKSGIAAPTDPKTVFPMLQRLGKVEGIVERVLNGGRFKVLVPKAYALLTLTIAGVLSLNKEHSEVIEKGAQLATMELLNRDVTIEVVSVDQRGAFIGHLFIKGFNWAFKLISEGYGRVFESRDLEFKFIKDLLDKQEEAKKEQKGVWSPRYAREEVVTVQKDQIGDVFDLFLGYIIDPVHFYASKTQPSEQFMLKVVSSVIETDPLSSPPRKNSIVLGKSQVNEVWYRAKVVGLSESKVKVQFVDTGFFESLALVDLRPCPESLLLNQIPPMAHEYKLAFIDLPPSSEEYVYGEGLALFERFAVESHGVVSAKVAGFTREGVPKVCVTNSSGHSINVDLMVEGLVLLDRRDDGSAEYHAVKEAYNEAVDEHRGIFEYGEIDFED